MKKLFVFAFALTVNLGAHALSRPIRTYDQIYCAATEYRGGRAIARPSLTIRLKDSRAEWSGIERWSELGFNYRVRAYHKSATSIHLDYGIYAGNQALVSKTDILPLNGQKRSEHLSHNGGSVTVRNFSCVVEPKDR